MARERDFSFVETLKCGSPIPDWLLVLSPVSEHSVIGQFTVGADVDVYIRDGSYWMIQAGDVGHVLSIVGCRDVAIGAGNRNVVIPYDYCHVRADGTGGTVNLTAEKETK